MCWRVGLRHLSSNSLERNLKNNYKSLEYTWLTEYYHQNRWNSQSKDQFMLVSCLWPSSNAIALRKTQKAGQACSAASPVLSDSQIIHFAKTSRGKMMTLYLPDIHAWGQLDAFSMDVLPTSMEKLVWPMLWSCGKGARLFNRMLYYTCTFLYAFLFVSVSKYWC